VIDATQDEDAAVRLGAVLALQRAQHPGGEPIARRLLADPDPRVRQAALIWSGRAGMLSLRPELERAIDVAPVSEQLFEIYLATVERLTPEFVRAYRNREKPHAAQLPRSLPDGFVARFVSDRSRAEELRAVAVLHLDCSDASQRLLRELAREPRSPLLRLEAVRSLAYLPGEATGEVLLAIARDPAESAHLRAEALAALGRQPTDATSAALALLQDAEEDVRLEAARYLRTRSLDEQARGAVRQVQQRLGRSDAALAEQLARVPGGTTAGMPPAPDSRGAWEAALEQGGGDAARGARVFHSAQSTCSQCHAMNGRGGTLGPDLSNVGQSKSRQALIQSILDPSAEVSPEFQGWYIRTRAGRTHQGRQIDVGRRSIELYVLTGEFIEVDMEDIADFGTLEQSLMPAGLENGFTVSELRDLIHFMEVNR
jgi:putative heme-binding domain-containing protein